MDRSRYTDTARRGIVTKEEVQATPVDECHKELILTHFNRLTLVLNEEDVDSVSRYVTKHDAREQLARMTLVIRDYNHRHPKGVLEDEVENMVADVVDASFFAAGKEGTFTQSTFVNPLLFGREQEIAALIQEMTAQGDDDVLELWNLPSPILQQTVLPEDLRTGEDIAEGVDWSAVLRRSYSDNDLLHHSRVAAEFGDISYNRQAGGETQIHSQHVQCVA